MTDLDQPQLLPVNEHVERYINEHVFPPEHPRKVLVSVGTPAPCFWDVVMGPCETVAGKLLPGQCCISEATADAIWNYLRVPDNAPVKRWKPAPGNKFLVSTGIPRVITLTSEPDKEQPMAADIEHKTFAVKREEWFVPTGDYTDQYGACWTDFMLAITYATNRLRELGKFDGIGEPASDLIKVVPHDAHVVVRIEYTEERK